MGAVKKKQGENVELSREIDSLNHFVHVGKPGKDYYKMAPLRTGLLVRCARPF